MTLEIESVILNAQGGDSVRMYDYSKLLGRMKEKGFTQETFSKEVGISECSLNLSLNNKRDFRQTEITRGCNALDIPISEVEAYFFAHKL